MIQCTETVLTFSLYVVTVTIFSMIARLLLLPLHQNLHQEAMPHQLLHQIHVFPTSITHNMITINICSEKITRKVKYWRVLLHHQLTLTVVMKGQSISALHMLLTSSASISSPNSSSTFFSTVGVVGVVGPAGDIGGAGARYQETLRALPLKVLPLLYAWKSK